MRKAIITLLAVLMLISFVSCNDQKVTEEMREQAMKDFVETMEATAKYVQLYGEEECEYDFSNWNSTTADKDEISVIKYIIEKLVGTTDITSAKGTYEVKNVSMKYNEEDPNVKFSANYVGKGIEITYTENGKGKSLTLDYDLTFGWDCDRQTKNATVKYLIDNLSVNGTKYRPVELETSETDFQTDEQKSTITRAVCDGIELSCEEVQKLIEQQ